MKRTIATTLLFSILCGSAPWAAFAGQSSSKADADGVADWGQGVKVRISKGSEATIQNSPGKVSASSLKGRFFIKLDGTSKVSLKTQSGIIVASRGEFLVDTEGQTKLHVFHGDAALETASDVQIPIEAKSWMSGAKAAGAKEVALRGSDIRRRDTSPDEFKKKKDKTKGVSNKKIKKINPVVTSSPPPVTENPPPPPPPPPVTQNPPPPPPENPPPPPAGGVSPWIIVGSALGLGTIIYFVTRGNDNNNPNPPASP